MMENLTSSMGFTWICVMVCNQNIITSHLFQDSLPIMVKMVQGDVDQVAKQGTG